MLTESVLRSWINAPARPGSTASAKKRGRKTVLSDATMKAIKAAIMETVAAETHLVNSTNLKPLIHGEILLNGEGDKVGERGLRLSKSWINRLCRELGLRMRSPTKASKKIPADWEAQGHTMLLQLAYLCNKYRLDRADVFNFDQTAVLLNPHASGGKTRAPCGSKDVGMQGNDDKRQLTAVPVVSAKGDKLPMQLIVKGKEGRTGALPPANALPPGFHMTQTDNHWSTVATNLALIKEIILPAAVACKAVRRAAGEAVSDKVLIILDCWPVQKSPAFRDAVNSKFPEVILLYVPPNLTGQFQPLDVAINGNFKKHMRDVYGVWAGKEVAAQRRSGVPIAQVKLLSGLKDR
jgi:hypothetical protein